MVIAVTGGGSGGHITPVLAVARALKSANPECKIVYIGQRGDGLSDIPAADPHIDAVYTVYAGKFRRYHGEGFRQLLDFRTQFLNLRDSLRVIRGTVQSYLLMRRLRPAVLFTRGGFVSVPVAFGAKLNGVPYLTHDSDSIPSLANRIIGRWASAHAVAMPPETYRYPTSKTKMVGIPVSHNYEQVTPRLMGHYRKLLKLEAYEQVLLVTGGGNGARLLNELVAANAPLLLKAFPKLAIVHIAGRSLEEETKRAYQAVLNSDEMQHVQILGFVTDLYRYSGAADVIIARGGATNLAEFAVQGKACLIIPSKQLLWNVKNSKILQERNAVLQLTEDQAEQEQRLARTIADLLQDTKKREQLGKRLAEFAHPHSADELAEMILTQAKGSNLAE